MKIRRGPFSWDQFIVLVMSLIGFSFTLTPFQTIGHRTPQTIEEPQVIDLGCIDSLMNQNTYLKGQTLIRLKGRLCSPQRKRRFDSSLKILNSSIGKAGVVFLQGQNRQFLTAEIPLIPGNNQFQIEWEDALTTSKKNKAAVIFNDPI